MQILIAVLLICFSISVHAQSPYHGGKGDGYASSEIQNVVLSINPTQPQSQFVNLYPNPAKISQTLQFIMPQSQPFQVEIINLLGQVVFNQLYNNEKANIPLSGCQPGSYIVNIHSSDYNYIQKLVVVTP